MRARTPASANAASAPRRASSSSKTQASSDVPRLEWSRTISSSVRGMSTSSSDVISATSRHEARTLALPVAVLECLALVVRLLALRERDLDLGAALAVEIDLQRHDRAALALDRADQLADLGLVQQQLARPLGLVVVAVARRIKRNVGVDQPRLAALLGDIRLGDRAAAAAQRLHLCARQLQARLEGLFDEVVEPRFAVLGHHLAVQFGFLGQGILLSN